VVAGDEPHPTHVGGEGVHLIDPPRRQQTLVQTARVAHLELVGVDVAVLGQLQIDTAHGVTLRLEERDEVVADEATPLQSPRHAPACRSHRSPAHLGRGSAETRDV